jgi:hypothetical protein
MWEENSNYKQEKTRDIYREKAKLINIKINSKMKLAFASYSKCHFLCFIEKYTFYKIYMLKL